MKITLRTLHLVAGCVTFLIFLYTGYHLRSHLSDLYSLDRWRFSMRGNHIYILMAALLHLTLGAYLRISPVRWRASLQRLGSLLIFAMTVLLVAAFFGESKAGPDRPVTLVAMICGLSGTFLHGVSAATAAERSP